MKRFLSVGGHFSPPQGEKKPPVHCRNLFCSLFGTGKCAAVRPGAWLLLLLLLAGLLAGCGSAAPAAEPVDTPVPAVTLPSLVVETLPPDPAESPEPSEAAPEPSEDAGPVLHTPAPVATPVPAAPAPTPAPVEIPLAPVTPAPVATDAPATPAPAPAATAEPEGPAEDGEYTDPDQVAAYIHLYGHLPSNYITKSKALSLGWESRKGNLWDVAPGKSIGGDRFGNYEGLLPNGQYKECDVNYAGGYRGDERLIYDTKGGVWYTDDHYETFVKLY